MAYDMSGLPKIEGLEAVAQSIIADKAPQQPQQDAAPQQVVTDQSQPAQPQAQADDVDWSQFKNPKDLLKSYKEIQGFTTRVSQENSNLKSELKQIKEQLELQAAMPKQQVPAYRPPEVKSFDQRFIEDPQKAIEEVATAKAMEMANTQRIAESLEEEEQKDPAEFNERVNYVRLLVQNNPQLEPLSRTSKGVRLLFNKADEYRKETTARKAQESLKHLLGEDFDLDKLKALVSKDQQLPNNPPNSNAYMPGLTGSTRTGTDVNLNLNNLEVAKKEAFERGDAAGVAGALLWSALSK